MVFQCINIRQVPWEVLKTEAEGLGFQHLPRDPANVNAWKTMFYPYIIIKYYRRNSNNHRSYSTNDAKRKSKQTMTDATTDQQKQSNQLSQLQHSGRQDPLTAIRRQRKGQYWPSL